MSWTAAERFPGLQFEHYHIDGKGWTWNAFVHGVEVKSADFWTTPDLARNGAAMWLARAAGDVEALCHRRFTTEATAAGAQHVIPGAEKRQRLGAEQTEFLF